MPYDTDVTSDFNFSRLLADGLYYYILEYTNNILLLYMS